MADDLFRAVFSRMDASGRDGLLWLDRLMPLQDLVQQYADARAQEALGGVTHADKSKRALEQELRLVTRPLGEMYAESESAMILSLQSRNPILALYAKL